MNFVIAGIVVILIMLCTVAGFMLALIKKLETLEDSLDVVEKLINIEKEFDDGIAESTGKLVDVCKNHLCAIENRCKGTEQMVSNCTASIAGTAEAVRSLRESTDTLEEQVTAITDYIREESFFDRKSLCDSCKYDNDEGSANVCCYCSERAICNYEPKNAFEQAGDV